MTPPIDSDSRSTLAVIAVFALAVLAYLPALWSGFVWDDHYQITDNVLLRTVSGLASIWTDPSAQLQYYPLANSSYWLEYRLWGAAPLGYHAVNLVLNAANAVLVYLLFARLGMRAALFGALVFALHPLQVESVAWVSERRNLLSGLFYLATLLAWLRHLDTRRAAPYVAALASFALAMASKTAVCTLPVAMLAWVWWRAGPTVRRDALRVVPFALVAAAGAALTISVEHAYYREPSAAALGPLESLLVASRAFCWYAQKLAVPLPLMAIYPRWEVNVGALEAWLFPAAVVALFGALFALRRRIGPVPLAGMLFFGLTLSPTLGFVSFGYMGYSFVADRFFYLASLGPIAIMSWGLGIGAARLGTRGPAALAAAAAFAALVLTPITWTRSRVFENDEVFWRDSLAKNPTAVGYSALGQVLFERGEFPGAADHFRRSLALSENFIARGRLGVTYLAQGLPDEAYAELDLALTRLRSELHLPQHEARLLFFLGSVFWEYGGVDWPRAIAYWEQARSVDPGLREIDDWLERARDRQRAEHGADRPPS
ncbi:MAG: glycosyltransferase family 39 protein [Myxococcota bacterium]